MSMGENINRQEEKMGSRNGKLTYSNIQQEMNTLCQQNQKCWHDKGTGKANDCPYFDICFENYEGPNNGNTGLETAILSKYMELKTGKPHSKFYFTFGSDPGFPYQNTYIIILAESKQEAVEKFRAAYPDRHKDTVNCAFWYSEEQWHGSRNETGYREPAEVFA